MIGAHAGEIDQITASQGEARGAVQIFGASNKIISDTCRVPSAECRHQPELTTFIRCVCGERESEPAKRRL